MRVVILDKNGKLLWIAKASAKNRLPYIKTFIARPSK